MNAPVITFRQITNPWDLEAGQTYKEVTPGGTQVPVVAGENSVAIRFRIYNNFALAASIATATNVALTVYDGAGAGSHTCAVLPVSQSWVHAQMYGFGENSVANPDAFTYFLGEDTAIGGSSPCGGNSYTPEEGSDGVAGSDQIRAYSSGNGMGYIEFSTYVSAPDAGVAGAEYGFAFSLFYEWTP